MGEPRYVIIHGHFYQPPRESPWTGLISPEPGAAPFPNWNERILSESYTANAHAHTMEGTVVHVRNNYESMDFDVGPTLALWLQTHGKAAYRAMLRGDMLSREHTGGYGNAISQSYNHSILPLLAPRSRNLQIAWGVEDFVYRFGRRPIGMWLPECAVDEETLEAVADAGLKFIILAPQQGKYAGDESDTRAAGPFQWQKRRTQSRDLPLRPRNVGDDLLWRRTRRRRTPVRMDHGDRACAARGSGADARDRRRDFRAS